MASRSVNNLMCKDDMRRAYREKAGRSRRRVKVRDIIDILDIIVPVIPHFFGGRIIGGGVNCSAGPDNYNNNMGGGYGREDDMPFRCGNNGGGRFGLVGMASGDYGSESGHYGHGNANHNAHHGMRMARAEDYGDREISEEEFERLLEYAEQCNVVKMY